MPCVCECAWSLVPGTLFPWAEDTGYACVERCDGCRLFADDVQAAIAVAKKLDLTIFEITAATGGSSHGHINYAVGLPDRPLSFEEGVLADPRHPDHKRWLLQQDIHKAMENRS